jgi:hypothetical protein
MRGARAQLIQAASTLLTISCAVGQHLVLQRFSSSSIR